MAEELDPNAAAQPGSGLFGLVSGPEESLVHVVGVPFDATTSYRAGTAAGPEAIERASRQVDLFDLVTGRPYERGIWMAPADADVIGWNDEARARARPVIEAGGANDEGLRAAARAVDAIQERLNEWLEARAREALGREKLFFVVGGDHSVSFGTLRKHAERYPGLGVLHFDAHADLRAAYEGFTWSHASILRNAMERIDGIGQLLQVGLRDLAQEELEFIQGSGGRIRAVFDPDWAEARLRGGDLTAFVRREIAALPREVYVTFDVDGLDPSLCTQTGTPVPGGLTWNEAMLWLAELVRSGRRLVGADLVEVAPEPGRESGSGWDEIVGARLLYRLIGFAVASSQSKSGAARHLR